MNDLDHEEMLAYFENFDSNHNGVLEFSEFAELIRSFWLNVDDKQLREGFNKVDTGNNDRINFEEFMVWWGENQ